MIENNVKNRNEEDEEDEEEDEEDEEDEEKWLAEAIEAETEDKCPLSLEELEKQFNKSKRCPHCGEKIYLHGTYRYYTDDSPCKLTYSFLLSNLFLLLREYH
jgi:formylmethanofuran dehydrogenase subunit E